MEKNMNSNRKLLAIHALLLVVGSFAAVNQIRCSEVDALKNITSDINELAQTSPLAARALCKSRADAF